MCLIQFIEGLGRTKGLTRENLLSASWSSNWDICLVLPSNSEWNLYHHLAWLAGLQTTYHGILCTLSIIVWASFLIVNSIHLPIYAHFQTDGNSVIHIPGVAMEEKDKFSSTRTNLHYSGGKGERVGSKYRSNTCYVPWIMLDNFNYYFYFILTTTLRCRYYYLQDGKEGKEVLEVRNSRKIIQFVHDRPGFECKTFGL